MISGGFVSFELTSSFFLKDAYKYQSDNPQAGFCKDWNFTEQAVGFYEPFEQHCLQLLSSFSVSVLKKEPEYCF